MDDFDTEFEELAKGLADELQNNPPNQRDFGSPLAVINITDLNTDPSIEGYINASAQKSNEILTQVIARLAPDVGDDPDRIDAFSKLIKSNTDLLKIFNDQLISNRNNQTKIEVAKIKQSGENLKAAITADGSVVANRDEMFRALAENAKEAVVEDLEDLEDLY